MPKPLFRPPRTVKLRPRLSPSFLRSWVPALARLVSGPYLRLLGYRGVTLRGEKAASELWRQFYRGEVRLIVAFRHPYGNDPQVLTSAVVRGISVPGRIPFLQFVHGVEVGWWAGPLARWILPRTGGLPVDHGRSGVAAFEAIRRAIGEGGHPLALAPEGQVTYSARLVQRVEPGFARLGFLAAEDLQARENPARVVVLPVSFFHRYPASTERRLGDRLSSLERLWSGSVGSGPPWARLRALRDQVFLLAEAWYTRHHGHPSAEGPWEPGRLLPLLETALSVAEGMLGLPHQGEFFTRLYRIRSTGWDRFFPDPKAWAALGQLGQALAFRSVTETWVTFRHMELADLAWYLGAEEPKPDWDTSQLADALENLYDLGNRLSGGNISHRKVLFPRSVETVFGDPIDLTARLPDWRSDKRETLARTVADLIKEWNRG